MTRPLARAYRFATEAQWRAGIARGLRFTARGMALERARSLSRIAGIPAGALVTLDGCGRLVWVTPADGAVGVLYEFGPEERGRLPDIAAATRLIWGDDGFWLRLPAALRRFEWGSLRRLGEVAAPGLVDAASDGCGGLWLLQRRGGQQWVRHVDAWGLAGAPIALEAMGAARMIAASPDRKSVLVVTGTQLHRLALDRCQWDEPLALAWPDSADPPVAILAGEGGLVHLLSARGRLLSLDAGGTVAGEQRLPLVPRDGPAFGLLEAGGLVLLARGGAFRLVDAQRGEDALSEGRYIIPPLVSPDGIPGGWNRADLSLELPPGARLTITPAATNDPRLIAALAAAHAAAAGGGAAALAALEARIPWRPDRARSYEGRALRPGDPPRRVHLLLDGIPETHLWLRIELTASAGTPEASLGELTVRYPDFSLLDDLPAVYRADVGSAAKLRRFLAPFEALFDRLDETIDRLPENLDPERTADGWLGPLLGWLGFPPTDALGPARQRALLREAAELLAGRGTAAALERVLTIVTGHPAMVEDDALAPAFWALGSTGAAPLGGGTRLLSMRPAAWRLGKRGGLLGSVALDPRCADLDLLLGGGCARIVIRIALDPAEEAAVLPVVNAMLRHFVPAHCRHELIVAAPASGGGAVVGEAVLPAEDGGAGLVLGDGRQPLGRAARAGCWRIGGQRAASWTIGQDRLDGGSRLM